MHGRPLHDQRTKRDGAICPELQRSLLWWKTVLQLELAELRPWKPPQEAPIHMFGDASSTPPYLGAVLFADGKWEYTHMAPPSEVLERFRRRRDKQIMGLELLAISLGLSTWREKLKGRKVVIHSDNKGSEVCLPPPLHPASMKCLPACSSVASVCQLAFSRGSARAMDHAQLVHCQWLHAVTEGLEIFVKRVATDDNIADLPSRKVSACRVYVLNFICACTIAVFRTSER